MNTRFLDIDIEAVTFRGISLSPQRKLALIASLMTWFGLSVALFHAVSLLDANGSIATLILLAICTSILDYIVTGRFVPHRLVKAIVQRMPLFVLYQRDLAVLEKARTELFELAGKVRFEDYLIYAKINPHIRSHESLRVMVAQRRGVLHKWTAKPEHLKKLANLVYQIHLVEMWLEEDRDRF